jgi:hypothetical protein
MKTMSQNRQSVAWFRLAECVDRGEKEKALAFHRLLTHSYNDRAFIKKLEADILAFFQDVNAVTAYEQAASLYAKEGKIFEAAVIYEYLFLANLQNQSYKEKLVSFLTQLGHTEKVLAYSVL